MNIKLLKKIAQIKMFVQKNKRNEFANFNFRNLDDILFVLKSELEKNNLYLYFDTVTYSEERLFMTLNIADLDDENSEIVRIPGQIKIDWGKAKMDDSQRLLSAKTFLKKSMIEDIFLLSSDDPDQDNNLDNIPKKAEKNANKDMGTDKDNDKKDEEKKETNDKALRLRIGKMLIEMEGDKEKALLKLTEITTFEVDGKIVKGVDSLDRLKENRLKTTYGKIKQLYELWKKNNEERKFDV
jgi:hypothetical protein